MRHYRTNVRKKCPTCGYKTLVYPPDHKRCSGCGMSYDMGGR